MGTTAHFLVDLVGFLAAAGRRAEAEALVIDSAWWDLVTRSLDLEYSEAMPRVKIVITRDAPSEKERVVVREIVAATESGKQLTASRIARVLAQRCPEFRRAKGPRARMAGVDVLPVVERTQNGWQAWRLEIGADAPSGWQPPLPGRVGKLNATNNPFADRTNGVWLRADISEW